MTQRHGCATATSATEVRGAVEVVSNGKRARGNFPEEAAHAYGDVNGPHITEMFGDIQISVEMLVYPEHPRYAERCKPLAEDRGRGQMSDNGISQMGQQLAIEYWGCVNPARGGDQGCNVKREMLGPDP